MTRSIDAEALAKAISRLIVAEIEFATCDREDIYKCAEKAADRQLDLVAELKKLED